MLKQDAFSLWETSPIHEVSRADVKELIRKKARTATPPAGPIRSLCKNEAPQITEGRF